ncbi:ClpP family protease [Nesterenkonia xinjiangensis]|uniref:ATP-dependent Clp protease proteolytic subunit n=1 Tax=Nesterenkonia xinjiangensis TaxID=225327 RepID=A0A7Z0K8Q0_9MICC|nr:ATP-dependent Clp protease proteolytic subunit [Nesterenkonia xinjiangensis]NYJ76908.1 ATP-dependent Clp protease protease subunit [Nesterenkonia xinjiangensis]
MSEETPAAPMFGENARQEMLHRRVLVLDGVLDDDNGTLLMTQLMTLAADDPQTEIALWIHSPGGSVPAMLALRDLMGFVPCPVSTLALGVAASAGQFLLSAGTPGRRRALPHAKILMHQGSSGIGGSTADVELQAQDLRSTRDTVLGLIAEDTGRPLGQVFDDSLRDTWFSAAEAVTYGFVDGVAEDFGGIVPRARRRPVGLTSHLERVAGEETR